MKTFSDRISAQRELLQLINSHQWEEPLFGLSSSAIERWKNINQLSIKCQNIYDLVVSAGNSLFFLANKSQEQITEKYESISFQISNISNSINHYLSQDVAPTTCKAGQHKKRARPEGRSGARGNA